MGKEKKELTEEQKQENKKTGTAFLLFFPSLIIAAMAIINTKSIWLAAITIGLTIYQFLLLKQFIDSYYK